MISNLITNALKFTTEGYIAIQASFNKLNNLLQIRVIDTGVGINIEDEIKLFKLFGKLETNKVNHL